MINLESETWAHIISAIATFVASATALYAAFRKDKVILKTGKFFQEKLVINEGNAKKVKRVMLIQIENVGKLPARIDRLIFYIGEKNKLHMQANPQGIVEVKYFEEKQDGGQYARYSVGNEMEHISKYSPMPRRIEGMSCGDFLVPCEYWDKLSQLAQQENTVIRLETIGSPFGKKILDLPKCE